MYGVPVGCWNASAVVDHVKLLRNLPGWLVEDFGVNFSLRRAWQRVKRRVAGFVRRATANRRTPAQVAQDRINAFLGGGEYSESARAFMGAFFLKMRKYVPKPYAGRVLLFKAKTEPLLYLIEADQRWKKLATDLEIFRMAGTHVSIVEERHVATLAAHLNKRLRECRERVAGAEAPKVAMSCIQHASITINCVEAGSLAMKLVQNSSVGKGADTAGTSACAT